MNEEMIVSLDAIMDMDIGQINDIEKSCGVTQ